MCIGITTATTIHSTANAKQADYRRLFPIQQIPEGGTANEIVQQSFEEGSDYEIDCENESNGGQPLKELTPPTCSQMRSHFEVAWRNNRNADPG